jgi:hypothetical protein
MVLNKAKKKLITQKPAAEELSITERHVRRLLRELQRRQGGGARATGLPSNRKISADTEKEAVAILSQPVYLGFGPTLAAEYLAKKHGIEVSRETVRLWMTWAKLWRPANRALLEREAAGLGRATPTWHDTALQMWVRRVLAGGDAAHPGDGDSRSSRKSRQASCYRGGFGEAAGAAWSPPLRPSYNELCVCVQQFWRWL